MFARSVSSLFFLLYVIVLSVRGELLMAVWVARHGAREPNNPHNDLIVPFGKTFRGLRLLTNIGMRQHYILGRIFSDTYKDQIDISPSTVVVRSTIRDRTYMSGMSFLRGFGAQPIKLSELLVYS